MLVELGFVNANTERGSAIESVTTKGHYPKQASLDGTARVLAGNAELAMAKVLDRHDHRVVAALRRGGLRGNGSDGRGRPIKSAPVT